MKDLIFKQMAVVMREGIRNNSNIPTHEALTIVYNADIAHRMYMHHNYSQLIDEFNEKLETMTQEIYDEYRGIKPKKIKTGLDKEIDDINTMGYRE